MEEPLAAQLEWWGNSNICLRFDVQLVIEEAGAELVARGALKALAGSASAEAWELLNGMSPYFRLVFEDGSVFEVEVQRLAAQGCSRLAECDVQRFRHVEMSVPVL
ncbi:hypothetical protein [Glycomyces niveus]|uniref:Uncharacterized protein n=1 Tax=Glycomyces niveus TaxID=2820287 RepID=A0ABS3U5L1_9ACTN|nr:hypothetical protein [Glycomyces sp. NEAU-S30]MBO3734052.1 hypothetical protein [Glycomyces sp. NEAU-S30]